MAQPTIGIDVGMVQRLATCDDLLSRDLRPESAEPARRPHFEFGPEAGANAVFEGSEAEFARRVSEELAPAGVLEELLASRLIVAAWRVNAHLAGQATAFATDGQSLEELELALGRAVCTFERARSARRACWGYGVPSESVRFSPPLADHEIPYDSTILSEDLGWSRRFEHEPDSDEIEARSDSDVEVSTDPGSQWRDRLVFDPDISDRSPAVKGTWITVSHVVSLVVDGWTWADILRAHPELSEPDIRACLTYSVEEEGSGQLDA